MRSAQSPNQKRKENSFSEKKESDITLLRKYISTSWEVNMILSGYFEKIDKKYISWTNTEVKDFKKWFTSESLILGEGINVFRGVFSSFSPFFDELGKEEFLQKFTSKELFKNKSFVSSSRDRKIAKEFSSERGSIHTFYLSKGCKIIDVSSLLSSSEDEDIPRGKAIKREKEVIIGLNHTFTPVKKYKNSFHWIVTTSNF